MARVEIPHSHFIKSAKVQYADHQTAIFREAIQNSVDAGATLIQINVGEDSVEVIDNGCGMNAEVLVKALLTMSGTFKANNSIGGFGAAKELLLFQHEGYEVHSQDNVVIGSVLDYEMTKGPMLNGTRLFMKFHESYEFNQTAMRAHCASFLYACDIRNCVIMLDGRTYDGFRVDTMVRDLGWGILYCEDAEEAQNELVVRIKGVKMFSRALANVKKRLVIEITKPSTDILTANRDGFIWWIGNKMDELVAEITTDKSSFGRLHNTISQFKGQNRSFIIRVVQRLQDKLEQISEALHPEIVAAKVEINHVRQHLVAGTITQEQALEKMKEVVAGVERTITPTAAEELDFAEVEKAAIHADFYIQVNNKGMDEIPKELLPGSMKKRYQMIAQLWKAAITHVINTNSLGQEFCLGFVVDDTCEAQYCVKDGIKVYMINPYSLSDYSGNDLALRILMVASHEVAHSFTSHHDEYFNSKWHELTFKALATDWSPRKLLLSGKEEEI